MARGSNDDHAEAIVYACDKEHFQAYRWRLRVELVLLERTCSIDAGDQYEEHCENDRRYGDRSIRTDHRRHPNRTTETSGEEVLIIENPIYFETELENTKFELIFRKRN